MRSGFSRSTVLALSAATAAAIAVPWAADWVPTARLLEWSAITVAAIASCCLPVQRAACSDRRIMAPSFVALFVALLMFRLYPAVCAAVTVAAVPALTGMVRRPRQIVLDILNAAASMAAAGLAYQATAVVPGVFEWPLLALPLISSVLAFHLVQRILSEVIAPLVLGQPIDRTWLQRAPRGLSVYLLGAATSGVIVLVIDRRLWDVAPVVAVALVLAYRA